jgi:hypothetical protein
MKEREKSVEEQICLK